MRPIRAGLILGAVFVALCGGAVSAEGAAIFEYSVSMDDGAYTSPASGQITINGLDTTKTTRIVVTPAVGPNRYDVTNAAGASVHLTTEIAGLSPGDTITVRQPSGSVAPTESLQIPAFSLDLVVGSSVIIGNFPAGLSGAVLGDFRCSLGSTPAHPGPGVFSIPYSKILPGEIAQISAVSSSGDNFQFMRHAPGETPCVEVAAKVPTPPATGGTPDPKPYSVSVDHLGVDIAPSVRVVVRRGATILVDKSVDSTYVDVDFETQPLPGDIVDIYRPKTAPTPMHTRTIPAVTSTFDPSVDLVSIDGPAAGLVMAAPCRAYTCPVENLRAVRDVPAGRALLNFAIAESFSPPFDLRADDRVSVVHEDPDHTLAYVFTSRLGDLVAPIQSIKLASKLKRKTLITAFKKGYKIKVNSNEAGPATLSFAFPKSKAGKAVTLAKVSRTVAAGTSTVKLKFTKAGKKALRRLRKGKSRLATLTSTVTDASGNASTLVKRTKIKA